MIHDVALRWVVTVLFGLCGAAFVVAIARGRRWITGVGQALHVVMAVAMAVMAWPGGAKLPTTGPMVFFLVAAAWFAALALAPVGAGHRVINAYHGVMMLAMAWMYAVMAKMSKMPGMAMPGMGRAGWLTAVNSAITVGFALATVVWIYRYFTARQRDSMECADQRPSIVGQTMMAAGMAIMFGVML